MATLILKHASASRRSGEWSDDDYDVLADGKVVGRIFQGRSGTRRDAVDVDARLRGTRTAPRRTAMSRRAQPRWRRSPRAGAGNRADAPLAWPLAPRNAQHAAGNLDNRHVEVLCAVSAHANVSVLYQFVDTAKRPWPTRVAPRRGFPVGQRVARSLPERWPAVRPRGKQALAVQGHRLALGAACRCPF
jgi:hypothetical protein